MTTAPHWDLRRRDFHPQAQQIASLHLPRTPSPFTAASAILLLYCPGGSKTDRRFGSLSDRRAQEDASGQTLLVQYPTLYPSFDVTYVTPRVRIEAGARSALEPNQDRSVVPYVADDLPDWSLSVAGVKAISPERTYWEKLLILHGLHCGYRDIQRLPRDRDRISRHYYDAAMITATETGRSALSNIDLLHAVRDHNLIAFRQAWKRFDQAVPGSVRLVPQPELRAVIEGDYRAMQGMILGDVREFEWVMDQLQRAQATIN